MSARVTQAEYNENWVDESIEFGAVREHLRLDSFAESSVTLNWRDSELVAPLPATCPPLPEGHEHAWTESPVEIESDKCQFLIIHHRDFDSVVEPAYELEMEIIEIADGKLTQYTKSNGEWQTK